MAATQPTTIAPTVSSEPIASVDTPVRPCPIVQPSAVTPPKPIITAPTTWLPTSSTEPKPSHRNERCAIAIAPEPTIIPSTPAIPNVTMRDWSVHRNSSSSKYAIGATKLYDSARPELV